MKLKAEARAPLEPVKKKKQKVWLRIFGVMALGLISFHFTLLLLLLLLLGHAVA
jgi:hypothetical protein